MKDRPAWRTIRFDVWPWLTSLKLLCALLLATTAWNATAKAQSEPSSLLKDGDDCATAVSAVRETRASSNVGTADTVVAPIFQRPENLSILPPEQAFPATAEPSFLVADVTSTAAEMEPFETIDRTASTSSSTSPLGQLISPEEVTPTLRTVTLIGLLSLVPAVLVMTTCFARFAIVFGLLRQGLGAQQWLPNQIVLALSLFLTLFVMAPVWTKSYETGIRPYATGEYATSSEQQAAFDSAITQAAEPVREFMSTQIAATGNEAAIDMLLSYQETSDSTSEAPRYYEDVPFQVLLPAYLLSELKTAFVIGFQIVLPFLVIDLVVASVLTGMGLIMLPPVLVSLPFKLLLFVLMDGWTLTVEMLLTSLPTG